MKLLLATVLAAHVSAFAANPKFNGRWDITVTNEPRHRAWWLEVNGAETATPTGKFISAYAGDLNVIDKIQIEGEKITFSFNAQGNRPQITFKARLAGDKLVDGTVEDNGKLRQQQWNGVRAPVIKDKDDGSWKKGKPVDLFNGKDMTGWKGQVPGKPLGWTVKDGVLTNTPAANNLIGDQSFWNFDLHVEYRVGPKSNSGIGLRSRYEIQILEDYGRPPNTHTNGALYSRIPPSENVSKPAGEWQTFDIRLIGRHVKVVLNGKKVVEGEIEGLTAVAVDPHEGQPGPLILQGDHGSVEFRKIALTPLTK